METDETRILQRYFRKTKAHPEGSVNHLPNCGFFSPITHCSCGLIMDLRDVSVELLEKYYPLFPEELVDHEAAYEKLTAKSAAEQKDRTKTIRRKK